MIAYLGRIRQSLWRRFGKPQPNLEGELAVDLPGFGKMRRRSHVYALSTELHALQFQSFSLFVRSSSTQLDLSASTHRSMSRKLIYKIDP